MSYQGLERRKALPCADLVVETLKATGQYRNGSWGARFWREWGQTIISLVAILGAVLLAWKDTERERAVVLNELGHIKTQIERLDRTIERVDDRVNAFRQNGQ